MSVYIYMHISIYIYICVYTYTHTCTHTYIYTHRERERDIVLQCVCSGATTCLTLLVERRFSSENMNNAADSASRIRQVMT